MLTDYPRVSQHEIEQYVQRLSSVRVEFALITRVMSLYAYGLGLLVNGRGCFMALDPIVGAATYSSAPLRELSYEMRSMAEKVVNECVDNVASLLCDEPSLLLLEKTRHVLTATLALPVQSGTRRQCLSRLELSLKQARSLNHFPGSQ